MRNFKKTVIWYSVDCILAWTSNSSHLYHKQQKQPMSSKLWLVNWTTSVQHHSKVKLTFSTPNLRLDCSNESSFKFPETSIFECSSLERIYFSRNIKNSHLHYSENSHQPSALNMYRDDRTNGCLSWIMDNRVFVFL